MPPSPAVCRRGGAQEARRDQEVCGPDNCAGARTAVPARSHKASCCWQTRVACRYSGIQPSKLGTTAILSSPAGDEVEFEHHALPSHCSWSLAASTRRCCACPSDAGRLQVSLGSVHAALPGIDKGSWAQRASSGQREQRQLCNVGIDVVPFVSPPILCEMDSLCYSNP